MKPENPAWTPPPVQAVQTVHPDTPPCTPPKRQFGHGGGPPKGGPHPPLSKLARVLGREHLPPVQTTVHPDRNQRIRNAVSDFMRRHKDAPLSGRRRR